MENFFQIFLKKNRERKRERERKMWKIHKKGERD